jgi:hypothetical protein
MNIKHSPLIATMLALVLSGCRANVSPQHYEVLIGVSPDKKEFLDGGIKAVVKTLKSRWQSTAKITLMVTMEEGTIGSELIPTRTSYGTFQHKLMLEKLKKEIPAAPDSLTKIVGRSVTNLKQLPAERQLVVIALVDGADVKYNQELLTDMATQMLRHEEKLKKICIFGPGTYELRDAVSESFKPIRTKVMVRELSESFVDDCYSAK